MIQRISRAANQTQLQPIGFYHYGITHPEGSELYYFYVQIDDSGHTFWDIEFYIDEVGHLYRNHVIYQYTTTGEDLLDLVQNAELWHHGDGSSILPDDTPNDPPSP